MIKSVLVITFCPKCGQESIITEKGRSGYCLVPDCGGYVKEAYGREFVVAVGGKKGLIVAPIKK